MNLCLYKPYKIVDYLAKQLLSHQVLWNVQKTTKNRNAAQQQHTWAKHVGGVAIGSRSWGLFLQLLTSCTLRAVSMRHSLIVITALFGWSILTPAPYSPVDHLNTVICTWSGAPWAYASLQYWKLGSSYTNGHKLLQSLPGRSHLPSIAIGPLWMGGLTKKVRRGAFEQSSLVYRKFKVPLWGPLKARTLQR